LSAKRAIESEKKSQFPQAEDPRPFKRDRRESEDAFTVPPPAFHKFNTVYIAPDGLHDATTMEAGTGRHVSNDKVPFTRSDEEDCDLPCLPGIRVSRNIAHDKIYRCGMTGCDVTFTSVTNAAEHMQSAHDVPRPFLCRVEGCCANFASKAVLSMHARVHSGEKPFKCTHKGCNAAFGQKSNLKRHMLVHTGARPVRT
jgi:Zinc finger, C2H2 type/Zinc-finger of C2H2 type